MMKNNKIEKTVRKVGIAMAAVGGTMILGSAAMGSMIKCKSQRASDKIMRAIDDTVSKIQNIMR